MLGQIDVKTGAPYDFCRALVARPDIVLPLAHSEELDSRARLVFDQATHECASNQGWRLFVDGDSGYWIRPDEASASAATCAFRAAVGHAIAPQLEAANNAEAEFCRALEIRPDIILPLSNKEQLSSQARTAFDSAKHKCLVSGGWKATGWLQHRRITH
jgi:hypothetical protein